MTKKLTVLDNEGITFDRYTVITPEGNVYGMSYDPSSPTGFNQYCCQESDLRPGYDGIGIEIHPIPDCIVLGLTDRGYSAGTVAEWVIESDKDYWKNQQ